MRRKDNEGSEASDPRAKRREYERLYRERNRERLREYGRHRYREDPQRDLERVRRYQQTEKGRAAAERFVKSEKRKQYMQAYRAQANENSRVWYQRNLAAARRGKIEASRRRLARLKANGGHFTRAQLEARIAFWGYRCWICRGPWETVDHVKPVVAGGPSWPSNLRPVCKTCNEKKGASWPFSV